MRMKTMWLVSAAGLALAIHAASTGHRAGLGGSL